ncbi:23S rRNA (adenine(2030)-N(6))-methyltransferase RlmJ [Variovorax dokdonensis]|uniref:Ribosomal RNA large subunit methyltransferase J n=1 Tax=Variovorax dokdonensis TaxID=344883 RepID=A0ABT7N554_9BURK|nr:23S rRNA (adenine(2030)-N(6))-methyltransferase RlmJ [Variovorax dokdonensis]MDM0043010.1 23S rRNA (adenine(2030)-N(6))-methyltransferase RlmJ [Variovorax dokdonensis]
MFSYRHAFHAGNHADVLKHVVLIAALDHLLEKDAALTVVDTHAGAGLYRLDGDYAGTSGEAAEGVHRLLATKPEGGAYSPAVERYIELLRDFNPKAKTAAMRVYPGSPFIAQHLLREHDKLKLFELHPTDARALAGNIAQLEAGRRIAVAHEDGFNSVASVLPPPSRRALLLCDPSYEIKTDYARVAALLEQALKRFATGTYAIWYPIIARPEAHALPRRLKTLAGKAGKPWLNATLTVKSNRVAAGAAALAETRRGGLPASGMFLVNPPWKLKEQLAAALPQLTAVLGQDKNAGFTLEAGD